MGYGVTNSPRVPENAACVDSTIPYFPGIYHMMPPQLKSRRLSNQFLSCSPYKNKLISQPKSQRKSRPPSCVDDDLDGSQAYLTSQNTVVFPGDESNDDTVDVLESLEKIPEAAHYLSTSDKLLRGSEKNGRRYTTVQGC